MLLVLSPSMTRSDTVNADSFVTGLQSCIDAEDLRVIEGDTDLLRQPSADDIVMVFNPETEIGRFRRPVGDFLAGALRDEVEVIAFSLDARSSSCPDPLNRYSPRSIPDTMNTYRFNETQYHDAGRVTGWSMRSRLHPTYDQERLTFFISYAHTDGHVGLEIERALSGLQQRVERDHSDPNNAPTTERVRALLNRSDVLVFVDTPAAAESEWIRSELCVALGTGIPIVWVRFAHSEERRLTVRPADRPDLEYQALPDPGEDLTPIAGEIVAAAFECAPAHVRRVENCLHRFTRHGSDVLTIDARQRAFEVTHRRPNRRHEQPIIDVVQLYGRRPTADDRASFTQLLTEKGYDPASRIPRFDLAAMVASSMGTSLSGEEPPIVMHTSEYVAARSATSPSGAILPDPRPELLLFASFASTKGTGQPIRDALQEITSCWLSRGGRICFGGHPTVTPTVDYVAATIVPGEERQRVTIYQSRYFVTPTLLEEYAATATIEETPNTGDGPEERARSLTLMREAMIGSDAVAAVVIGGLTRDDLPPERQGEIPGVEEEMLLARQRDIPVFLLGHTGGQAAVLATAARSASSPWSALGNNLTADDNEDLTRTDDYWGAAELIWDATVGSAGT